MDALWWFVFSLFVLACAMGLIVWHVRSWQAQQQAGLDADELNYRRRQFRRRMQSSAMLAGVAAALPVGAWLLPRWPKVAVLVWGGILLLLVWVGVLGLADIWDTKYYYGKLRAGYRLEQTRLQAELRRLRDHREARASPAGGNGRPPRRLPDTGPHGSGPEQHLP